MGGSGAAPDQSTNEPRTGRPPGGSGAAPHQGAHDPRAARPQTLGSRAPQAPSPRAVQEAAKELAGAAKSFRDVARGYAAEQARERPYVLLGSAAAVGFVLGGGLASRITVSLLVVGARMFGGRILTKVLEGELALGESDTDAAE
jgi:hypothetical protein